MVAAKPLNGTVTGVKEAQPRGLNFEAPQLSLQAFIVDSLCQSSFQGFLPCCLERGVESDDAVEKFNQLQGE